MATAYPQADIDQALAVLGKVPAIPHLAAGGIVRATPGGGSRCSARAGATKR